ncbi:Carbonic anhydrase [Mycena kentingensis (nom. inval.)]|nr:Carbonic anhydrase [Mycena kentingensis (nom. inval.)]
MFGSRVLPSTRSFGQQRANLFNAVQRKRDQAREAAQSHSAREEARNRHALLYTLYACSLGQVTCMDARINPFKQLGFREGDAHIIRNAGGMAKDAIRSLVISQRLLGTREIAVYHHTGCGMVTFRGPDLKQLVKWSRPGDAACASQVDKIDFLEFVDLEQSVKDDVQFLKTSPLILEGTKVTGWIHDIETGEASPSIAIGSSQMFIGFNRQRE